MAEKHLALFGEHGGARDYRQIVVLGEAGTQKNSLMTRIDIQVRAWKRAKVSVRAVAEN